MKKAYSLALVLSYLDTDIRRDVFIGITGLLIAVVVFIAEFINKQRFELYKRAFIRALNLKFRTVVIIISLIIMLPASLIQYRMICNKVAYLVLFCIAQLVINIFILLSVYFTISLFLRVTKMITHHEYSEKCISNYIQYRTGKLAKKISKQQKGFRDKQLEFNNYILNSNIVNYDLFSPIKGEYVPIRTKLQGCISSYDYVYLRELELKQNLENIDSENLILTLTKQPGDSISEGTIIAYCKEDSIQKFRMLDKAIRINRKYEKQFNEIYSICGDLLVAADESDFEFDENSMLLNTYSALCNDNNNDAIDCVNHVIKEYYRRIRSTQKTQLFERWLLKISHSAKLHDRFDDYCLYLELGEAIYSSRIDDSNNRNELAYNFANHFYVPISLGDRSDKNSCYYTQRLGVLLDFIHELIIKEEFESIEILLNNIFLERDEFNYFNKKANPINFQFVCGVSVCLYMIRNNAELISVNKKHLKSIVEQIKDAFLDVADAGLFIKSFKDLYNESSIIQKKYMWFDADFKKHKYQNSWSSYGFDESELLKMMLHIYGIDTSFFDGYGEIERSDKFFLERLKEKMIQDESPIEKIFDDINKKAIIDLIDTLYNDAISKEVEYKKTASLNKDKTEKFVELLLESASKKKEIIEYASDIGKSTPSKEKINRYLTLNNLIDRELFFDDVYGYDDVAKHFGNAISSGIEKTYIQAILDGAKKENSPFKDYLDNLDNPSEYIVIANRVNLWKQTRNNENTIKVKKGAIRTIRTNCIEGCIIVRSDELPTIKYCDFSEDVEGYMMHDYLAYSLEDCADNIELCKEIANRSDWLKEKGTYEEQIEYLKAYCRVRLIAAVKIETNGSQTSLIFEDDDVS